MSLVADLVATPGVIAAGEYSYRGDRYSYKGQLNDDMARMASIMCRATTMGVHMETDIMDNLYGYCGGAPARGWAVKGPSFTVCVIANVFCFLDNSSASLNQVLGMMREQLADVSDKLI
jgi:roadblock/LC7 domain-containing protein